MKQLNEGIIELDGIYKTSIINLISLIKKKVGWYEWQDTGLEKVTRENNAILTDKLQVSRDIQKKIEELKKELTSGLHYKVRGEKPKIIK